MIALDPFDPHLMPYDRLAAGALVDELTDAGRPFRVYHNQVTERGPSYTVHALDEQLVRDVEQGLISGLLVLGAIPVNQAPFRKTLAKQNIPVVEMSSLAATPEYAGNAAYVAQFDFPAMVDQAVSRAREVGARRVGLISVDIPCIDIWGLFRTAAERKGLVAQPDARAFYEFGSQTAGAEGASRIWTSARPDTLIVLDDVMAQGAVMALLELRLRIPDDIKLVAHANRGSELFFPVPLEKIEFDPATLVRTAWRMLNDRLEGRPVNQRVIKIAPHPLPQVYPGIKKPAAHGCVPAMPLTLLG